MWKDALDPRVRTLNSGSPALAAPCRRARPAHVARGPPGRLASWGHNPRLARGPRHAAGTRRPQPRLGMAAVAPEPRRRRPRRARLRGFVSERWSQQKSVPTRRARPRNCCLNGSLAENGGKKELWRRGRATCTADPYRKEEPDLPPPTSRPKGDYFTTPAGGERLPGLGQWEAAVAQPMRTRYT